MQKPLTNKPYDICCIGHITKDKVVTPEATVEMPGGTAYYFSSAISQMNTQYLLVTALAQQDWTAVEMLQSKGISVYPLPSRHTVFFENCYGHNLDDRTQRVLRQADAFEPEHLSPLSASVFHLGPLLAGDIPAECIMSLAAKGLVSLDVQGFLRKVVNNNVYPTDWVDKIYLLPYIHFLKMNDAEMYALTGCKEVEEGAKKVADWGVKEVVITLGSKGSVVYNNDTFYAIPAYQPLQIIDATGCGDTYMAGYLYQRSKGYSIQQAGQFAAAMATLKIGVSGPFSGTQEAVEAVLKRNKVVPHVPESEALC